MSKAASLAWEIGTVLRFMQEPRGSLDMAQRLLLQFDIAASPDQIAKVIERGGDVGAAIVRAFDVDYRFD